MKHLSLLALILPTLLLAQTPWNGTANTAWYNASDTVYTITTAEQLAGLATLVNKGNAFTGKTIMLGKDIALNDTSAQDGWRKWDESNAPANKWTPIGNSGNAFKGNFNGNGKVVTGLYINSEADNQGLFGIAFVGNISNLGLAGFYVKGKINVGGIIGSSRCTANDNTEEHYCSDGIMKKYGTLADSRDGKTYKTVVIGNQKWMAKNLDYDFSGSVCYDNSDANCNVYGRLYKWATAANDACPEGWHLPSDAE